MNDLLQKYGIPVGIIIASIVAIYFYGKSQYDKGKNDLRTELLLQSAKVDTVIKHDTIPLKGEAKGKPIKRKTYAGGDGLTHNLDSIFYDQPPDPCEDLKTPYVVEVNDKNVKGEIVCKPDSQSAFWDLKVVRSDTATHSSKYIEEQLSFWLTPLMGYNSDGVVIGGAIGYKAIGFGLTYQEKPTYYLTLHFDF